MKPRVKVKSSVHLNTLQTLLQRMRGIDTQSCFLYIIIPKKL